MGLIIPFILNSKKKYDNFMFEYSGLLDQYLSNLDKIKYILDKKSSYERGQIRSVVNEFRDIQALAEVYSSKKWDLMAIYCPLAEKYESTADFI